MMRILALAFLVMALAGCFGVPAGAAEFGDDVTIDYVVLDPASGEPILWSLSSVATTEAEGEETYIAAALRSHLAQRGLLDRFDDAFEPVSETSFAPVPKAAFDQRVRDQGLEMEFALEKQFTLGSGESGLGFQVERGLIGAQVNETVTLHSDDDRSRGFSSRVTRDALFLEGDVTQSFPRAQVEQQVGTPTEGAVFADQVGLGWQVVSFDNESVQGRVDLDDGQEFDASIVGSVLRADVGALRYEILIVPVEGETFTIQSNIQGTPLDLAPGTYRSVGLEGDQAVWAYSTTPEALVDRAIEVRAMVTEITENKATVPDGAYGERNSPVLPRIESVEEDDHDHGDDGHDDHTH